MYGSGWSDLLAQCPSEWVNVFGWLVKTTGLAYLSDQVTKNADLPTLSKEEG